MSTEYQTFALTWEAREIAVSYRSNWLNSGQWHIELRCSERLPVTATGYRSLFVPSTEPASEQEVNALVLAWLNEAAASKDWLQYLEDSRQLKLF